jgi:hypothetical protein
LEQKVQRRAALSGESVDKVRKNIEEEAKRRRYGIEFFESRGRVFYEPGYGNGLHRIARLNKFHPFFEFFYARLATLDPIARQTIDLLLLTLADAELSARGQEQGDEGDELRHMYETQPAKAPGHDPCPGPSHHLAELGRHVLERHLHA